MDTGKPLQGDKDIDDELIYIQEYIQDEPLDNYDKLAIIISITDYSYLREKHGKQYLCDIPSTKEEIFQVRAFLSRHGFED